MSARNSLLQAPPYAVEQALDRLGANLRTARLRRGLTIKQTADKIGTGPRAVSDAENGKPSAGIATYAGLLWAFDLLEGLFRLADPAADTTGAALALSREPLRSRAKTSGMAISDDF